MWPVGEETVCSQRWLHHLRSSIKIKGWQNAEGARIREKNWRVSVVYKNAANQVTRQDEKQIDAHCTERVVLR